MAEYTKNYKLKKPAQEDNYDVDDFNANADTIDEALGGMAILPDAPNLLTKYLLYPNECTPQEKAEVEGNAEYMGIVKKSRLEDFKPSIGDMVTTGRDITDTKFMPCDGRSLSISAYPKLYEAIGVKFGTPTLSAVRPVGINPTYAQTTITQVGVINNHIVITENGSLANSNNVAMVKLLDIPTGGISTLLELNRVANVSMQVHVSENYIFVLLSPQYQTPTPFLKCYDKSFRLVFTKNFPASNVVIAGAIDDRIYIQEVISNSKTLYVQKTAGQDSFGVTNNFSAQIFQDTLIRVGQYLFFCDSTSVHRILATAESNVAVTTISSPGNIASILPSDESILVYTHSGTVNKINLTGGILRTGTNPSESGIQKISFDKERKVYMAINAGKAFISKDGFSFSEVYSTFTSSYQNRVIGAYIFSEVSTSNDPPSRSLCSYTFSDTFRLPLKKENDVYIKVEA